MPLQKTVKNTFQKFKIKSFKMVLYVKCITVSI